MASLVITTHQTYLSFLLGLNGLQGLELSRIPRVDHSTNAANGPDFTLWLVEFSIGLVGCLLTKSKWI